MGSAKKPPTPAPGQRSIASFFSPVTKSDANASASGVTSAVSTAMGKRLDADAAAKKERKKKKKSKKKSNQSSVAFCIVDGDGAVSMKEALDGMMMGPDGNEQTEEELKAFFEKLATMNEVPSPCFAQRRPIVVRARFVRSFTRSEVPFRQLGFSQ